MSTIRYLAKIGDIDKIVVARIKLGSDLLKALRNIAIENNIRAGIILSGVGGLSHAEIRNLKNLPEEFPITDRNRLYTSQDGPFEILSISGNISERNGEIVVHAHISISYVKNNQVYSIGGHLIEGCIVNPFAEVIIAKLKGIIMNREYDEETKAFELFKG